MHCIRSRVIHALGPIVSQPVSAARPRLIECGLNRVVDTITDDSWPAEPRARPSVPVCHTAQ